MLLSVPTLHMGKKKSQENASTRLVGLWGILFVCLFVFVFFFFDEGFVWESPAYCGWSHPGQMVFEQAMRNKAGRNASLRPSALFLLWAPALTSFSGGV